MSAVLIELAAISRGTIVAVFAVLLLLIIAATAFVESPQGRTLLRRNLWYRRLEQLRPGERQNLGLVSLGLGLCSFAAMLTLELVLVGTPLHGWLSPWATLTLGTLAVAALTFAGAMLTADARR